MGKKKTHKRVYGLVEEVAAYGSKRIFVGTQGDRDNLEFYTDLIIKAVKGKGEND